MYSLFIIDLSIIEIFVEYIQNECIIAKKWYWNFYNIHSDRNSPEHFSERWFPRYRQHLSKCISQEIETSMRRDRNKNIFFPHPLYSSSYTGCPAKGEAVAFRPTPQNCLSRTRLLHIFPFLYLFFFALYTFPLQCVGSPLMLFASLHPIIFLWSKRAWNIREWFFLGAYDAYDLMFVRRFLILGLGWMVFINRRIFIVRWDCAGNSLIVLFIRLFNALYNFMNFRIS